MTAIPPPTLAFLAYHWGDAYLLSSVRDRWVALRRDGRYFLIADTLAGLETAISNDYQANPVSRDYDPPGTPEEMSWPPIPGLPCPGDRDDAGEATEAALNVYLADEESLNLLLLLRRTFPQWDISYAPAIRAWIARRHSSQTLCENSPALLAIALTLIERRERQHAHGPGWGAPPWEDSRGD